MDKRIRIGDLLIKAELITSDQLAIALKEQKKTGLKLGRVLVNNGYVSEDEMLRLLSQQLNLEIIDLSQIDIQHKVAKLLPEAYARKYRALVLEKSATGFKVAMYDPLDILGIDEVQRQLKGDVQIVISSEQDIINSLDIVYRRTDQITALAEELKGEFEQADYDLADLDLDRAKVDAPVVKFLRSVFEDAAQINASDIHFEPDKDVLRIRLRVNGELQEQTVKEKSIMTAIALRLKVMSSLNISERRLPQDGRFNIKIGKKIIDIRLSTLPTQYGESIVMRLLDQSGGLLNTGSIGMPKEQLQLLQKLVYSPNGILLVTGPTGSGKSTTLYAILNELNEPEKKIITAEDPVEYQLPRVNQVQINDPLGLTFASVLRTVLRQDPDIVLVGEMRDEETATIAIRAALTGHLVLSTLHTNDAPSTALRLMDMNIDGFLIAATLQGILAQRLVKVVCKRCAKPYELNHNERAWVDEHTTESIDSMTFKKGTGCSYCNKTGISGRQGVFELLELNEEMGDALRESRTQDFINLARQALKGKLLVDNAFDLAKQGITTIDEVFLLAGEGAKNANI
jgi:MSHA biogenesis protein MshE